jgi:hypothetical protein
MTAFKREILKQVQDDVLETLCPVFRANPREERR